MGADGRLMAVGAEDGSVSLVEMSDSLIEPVRDEKAQNGPFAAMVDRECQRDKTLTQRQKELRMRAKRKNSAGARDREQGVDESVLAELSEAFIRQVKVEEDAQLRDDARRGRA